MIVLTIAGKADSRVIVYPMLYILKHYGRVLVVTDDAAYRRLYHGYDDVGEVSGIGICVEPKITATLLERKLAMYLPDFVVCVTNGYVPDFTTHLLVVMGYDRTFTAGNAFDKTDLEKAVDVKQVDVDKVQVPRGFHVDNIRELFLSSIAMKRSQGLSVCLKDGLLLYVTKCEEYKELLKPDSRDFVGIVAKLLHGFVVSVSELEMIKLFGFKK